MILAWLAAAFVAGVVLGAWLVVPAWLALMLAGLLVLLAAALLRARAGLLVAGLGPAPIGLLPLLAAALFLGLARTPHPGPPTPHQLSYYNGRHVQVDGVVSEEPDIRDTGASYVVTASRVSIGGISRSVSGKLQLHVPRSQQLDYGDAVTLTGILAEPRNQPHLPYRTILAQRGIGSQMAFPRLVDQGPTNTGLPGWLVKVRQRLEAGMNAWLPEPEAALLIAIALGAHSASLGDLAPVLVATGLIHMIAISGIKVALVAGTMYQVVRRTGHRLAALVIPLCSLLFYVLLTGATASGVRSALMWALVFIAAYLGRNTVALASLAVAAALMTAVDPNLPWDTGFQLSTVGTFSIVALSGPLGRWIGILPSPFRESLTVTTAAILGTLPIVIVGFEVIAGTGPVANALALPLLPLLIALGFVLGALSGVAAVAGPVSALAWALLHAIVVLSRWLAALGLAVTVTTLWPPAIALYYAALAGISRRFLRAANWAPVAAMPHRGRELVFAAALGAATLTATAVHGDTPPGARVTWLGTGEAILVQSAGMTALVGGSPRPSVLLEHLGQLVPFQTHVIDLVVITDPRASNVQGDLAVLDHYRVAEVLDVGAEYPSATYARWRQALRDRRIPAYALRTGAEVRLGQVRLRALGPDALYPNPLDCIGVLRLETPRATLLLAGAASAREQREAVFRPVDLKADVLVLAGTKAADGSFVRTVRARRVMSTGPVPAPGGAARLGTSLVPLATR